MKKEELNTFPFIGDLDETGTIMSFDEDKELEIFKMLNPVCAGCFREFMARASSSDTCEKNGDETRR
jgi:hypothetical protein